MFILYALGIFKQTAYGAGGTVVGGVLAGPPGALIGGLAGSLIGYMAADEYKSMLKVMRNLDDKDKEKIVKKVQELVGSVGIEDLVKFINNKLERDSKLVSTN